MESARWERIQELFHAVADLPAAEQPRFLRSACGGDESLVDEVLALVAEDAGGSSPVDRGVAAAARQVLGTPPARIAQQLGPYRIVRLLGEGGMGAVYLAERADLRSQVAVKVLSDAGFSPARRERFASEQRTLAQLEHPAIARLYDAGALDDGTPYLVMEYVEGKPLTDHCRDASCTLEERLRLFRSLCEAVQFAHRHAIIHRDIKPSNVMVRPDGGVRLLDFGIAKHLEDLDASSTRTGTGVRLMTPAYAAPEQLLGERVGIFTDVYSLGVVLYELLSGRLPFHRRGSRTDGTEEDPDRPSSAAAASATGVAASRSAWADLDVLILTAMHRDPRRRYASVEAMIRDIDHYLRGLPLEARPDGAAYRLRKFAARHRRGLALTAATTALVIGMAVFFTARLAAARDDALAEAARTQRIREFMERMLTGGDSDVGPAKDLRVITMLDAGAREARALDRDPEVQADLFQTIGSLYHALGENDRADALLRSALDRHLALHGEGSGAAIDTMVMLGLLRDEQARYDEAEKLFRRALASGLAHLPAGDARTLRAQVALGRLLIHRSRHDQAISILEAVLRVQTAQRAPARDISTTVGMLANAHFFLGHYDESEALNLRALESDRKNQGERHPDIGHDVMNLGSIELQRGRFAAAEKHFRQGVSIFEEFYGRGNPEFASALGHLGKALVPQDKLEEASSALSEALAVFERTYGKVHPRVASTLGTLGHLARKRGDLDEAEALYRRQGDIHRALLDDDHFLHGSEKSNLAGVLLDRGDPAGAEKLLREALAINRRAFSADHPTTAAVQVRLGGALVLQRRFAEAEAHSLAGLGVLARTTPDAKSVSDARKDLVSIYEALGQSAKAARYRTEPAAPDRR